MRWSLPLRVWLAVALVAVVLAPILSWLGTVVAVLGPLKTGKTPSERQAHEALSQIVKLVHDRQSEWSSPEFQREMATWLQQGGLSAVLLDSQGRVVYRYGSQFDRYSLNDSEGVPDWENTVLVSYGDRHHVGLIQDDRGTVVGTYAWTAGPVLFVGAARCSGRPGPCDRPYRVVDWAVGEPSDPGTGPGGSPGESRGA